MFEIRILLTVVQPHVRAESLIQSYKKAASHLAAQT